MSMGEGVWVCATPRIFVSKRRGKHPQQNLVIGTLKANKYSVKEK